MHCDVAGMVIYLVGALGWLLLWWRLISFTALCRNPLLWIPFLAAEWVFLCNIGLCLFSRDMDFNSGLSVYAYVEQNATTISGMALGIAIFVVVEFRDSGLMMDKEIARRFLSLILWSFFISIIGCLPLYWIPAREDWLMLLKTLKTIPFTYALFILAAAIILFLNEIKKSQ